MSADNFENDGEIFAFSGYPLGGGEHKKQAPFSLHGGRTMEPELQEFNTLLYTIEDTTLLKGFPAKKLLDF